MKSVLLLVVLVGCTNAGSAEFEIDGTLSAGAPAGGKVAFVWDTLTTTYKWGDGITTPISFVATLDPEPPPEAQITGAGMAVGIPILIDGSETVADGVINFDTTARLGVATDYGVIWKDANAAGLGLDWEGNFGDSYSCAHCVRGGNGTHDGWELTACADISIVVAAATSDICNWN